MPSYTRHAGLKRTFLPTQGQFSGSLVQGLPSGDGRGGELCPWLSGPSPSLFEVVLFLLVGRLSAVTLSCPHTCLWQECLICGSGPDKRPCQAWFSMESQPVLSRVLRTLP